MIKVEKLNPFGRMCISLGMLPSSYKESLTYEEQLMWFCKYLEETVIPTVNNNADAVEELQTLYLQIKTYVDEYFENLDVQEEINNKLDEMADSGQLTDIIAQYLGLAGMITFDIVADMKTAQNLVNGSKCETLGYNSINDGGKALYKVREILNTDVVDECSIIALDDPTLVAELIEDKKDTINVLQWGAVGDGTTDNSAIFNKIIDYANDNLKSIYIPSGKYLIESDLHDIKGCLSIYGDVSGEGQLEPKATIIDNRTSSNYLFNIVQAMNSDSQAIKGGTIKYLNFVSLKVNVNNCIKTTNGINYFGNISNCNFLDFKVCVNINGSHGCVIDTCAFIRCGDKLANSSDYAIIITNTTDVSINNSCIDHVRYQLSVSGNSIVNVSNTHFELSKLNIVQGNSPIYCQTGNYGYVGFVNCNLINLSYKEWVDTAGYTAANVPYMANVIYGSFNNCMLMCGSGSGAYASSYDKQTKFIFMYYGSIDNCKIKSPSYIVPAIRLRGASLNNCHIQCDLETSDFSTMAKNYNLIDSSNNNLKNNYLQYVIPTTSPQTYPVNYPILSNTYGENPYIETNKNNIVYRTYINYSELGNVNTYRLQSYSNLFGAYHLKIYSIGEAALFFDGYIRINTDKTITLISTNQKSLANSNTIKISSDDDSNDVYIQVLEPNYKTNTVVLKIENLDGRTNFIMYYDKLSTTELSYTNSLTISN